VWSPSGLGLICRHSSYESEDYLFLLAADGSGKQVKLTSSITDGQLDFPAWSPDGKQLIVSRVSDGELMSLNITEVLKMLLLSSHITPRSAQPVSASPHLVPRVYYI
jgi:hypothetical protein